MHAKRSALKLELEFFWIYILSTKRNAMFLFAIFGVKIIDFKNCFNAMVLPSNKDLDSIVSS